MLGFFEIACGFVVLGVVLYWYFTSTYNFWKERNIKGPKPIPLFGNAFNIFVGKLSVGHALYNFYQDFKNEPAFGIFAGKNPILVLRDPEMIKSVLIKDFSNFSDRGIPLQEEIDPISVNLFVLETKRWRPLRAKFSPVFTTGKLKEMCALIAECAEHLEKYLGSLVDKGDPIEVRELTGKYTTDVIGSCAFGIEMNSLSDEENEFRRMGRKIFATNSSRVIRFKIQQMAPWLARWIAYFFPDTEMNQFIMDLTLKTMEYRKKNNIVRKDFINMLMELKDHPESIDVQLSDHLLVAQAMVFYAAGFETSATTMTHALYELALHQDIQEKLREEIEEADKTNQGDLTYDTIKKMEYLNKVFRETLRKHPPGLMIMRQAKESYTFENTKLTIPAKQDIWISIYGVHRDPEFYPDPEIFDPERFDPEVEKTRHPMNYIPFGDGPRNCLGARFAVYQTKIGLIKVLKNFRVTMCENRETPYVIDPTAITLAPKGGLPLRFSKLRKD